MNYFLKTISVFHNLNQSAGLKYLLGLDSKYREHMVELYRTVDINLLV